ncbi:MAG: bifunctional phosphoribosylaminoimidazolecarboxamide formyltransferase/IMP cyclohydrolase, partial [Acidobacteria bacterium]|nr:bifunctional phosphoribosylaminoimidazolecarboxamide formyltransferase/IMP cyclohydrolase [Acidobacteriota bacterium]
MPKIQRVLLSVTDKTGIVEFAQQLAELGAELISTGGTARALRDAGLAVRDVSDVTGFPEMLDGRVKTMHPGISGGILAIRANSEHMTALARHGIALIDMVVVNLYQFEKVAARAGVTIEHLIENIDIGGPTMIRAAAKNYQDVAVVVAPSDYHAIIHELRAQGGELTLATKWNLARKAFATTAAYDSAITAKLATISMEGGEFRQQEDALPSTLAIHAPRVFSLRYGENPHQPASLYASGKTGIAAGHQLQGKELSYNNLVDLDAAWQLVGEFERPASVIIKHTNPCGCAEQDTQADSYRMAFEADPVSAFGGVLAFNRPLDGETAEEVAKTFIEAIAAPDFTREALVILSGKKNLRLLRVTASPAAEPVVKSITGGFLVQAADSITLDESKLVVRTKRA